MALAAVSGCLQGPQLPAQPPPARFDPLWSELALPPGDGHDHADPMQHLNLSTPNFRVLGHDPLFSDYYGQAPGSTFCGDAKDVTDGRRIAAAESRSKVGFTLVDVTDPTDPKWIGELVMENTRVYDLAVVPDGRHVVLVTQAIEGAPLPVLAWQGACGSVRVALPQLQAALGPADPIPRPSSIILVDIADPAEPRVVDQHPLYGYGHSAYATILDGRTWILATTTGPGTAVAAYETTSAFEFYELQETPLGARLRLLSIYKPEQDLRNPGPPIEVGPRGHDAWIARHPGTGATLAYLAAWERMEVLDLADPASPRLIGSWTDRVPGREGATGEIHSVLPLDDLRSGRHYTLIGPEWRGHPAGQPTGTVWVLDTTDPTRPAAVAGWTLPHDVEWAGDFMFSNHYYGVVGDTLFVSMYHGGVWAVDLSPVTAPNGTRPAFTNLDSVGVFMPVDPTVEVAVKTRWAPTVEEVLAFPDGVLLTFDGYTGLWAFTFDPTDLAPAPEPWTVVPP